LIKFDEINNTGIITLQRPKALNALNLEMIIDIKEKLIFWKSKDSIHKILIKSEGKAFCAGGDIKAICLADTTSNLREDFFKEEYKLNNMIFSYPKIITSIWDGIVMGGGVGISLYGKNRIITEKTMLGMPESAIGFIPDVGSSYILSRMEDSVGLYLGLTGYVLNHFETYKLKLGNYFILSKNIKNFEYEYIYNNSSIEDHQNQITETESNIINNSKLIKKHFCSFDIEEIFKSLKSEKNSFTNETINHLINRCPTSLALTCKMFDKAKKLNFRQCLEMDFYLSQLMIQRDDFNNGVTEVLINKKKNTKWNPSSTVNINKKINNYLTFDINELDMIIEKQ